MDQALDVNHEAMNDYRAQGRCESHKQGTKYRDVVRHHLSYSEHRGTHLLSWRRRPLGLRLLHKSPLSAAQLGSGGAAGAADHPPPSASGAGGTTLISRESARGRRGAFEEDSRPTGIIIGHCAVLELPVL